MITIKRGDTAQAISDVLMIGTTPLDLIGTTVSFVMVLTRMLSNGTFETVSRGGVAELILTNTGEVKYTLTALDVGTESEGRAEWEIAYPTGKKLTVPSDGYIAIKIIADLNPPAA